MSEEPQLTALQSAPNARVTALVSTTVLRYGLSVTPSPLTVSDVVPAQPATLQLVVTNFTADPVAFDQIDLSFYVGGSPSTELALTPSVATTNAAVSDSDNWDFGISGAAPTSGHVTYTLAPSPSGSGALDAYGSVSVTLFPLPAPAAVGIAPVWVDETIAGDKETAKFQVTKYPEGFVFDSLTVCVTDSTTQQLVPVSQLGYMQPFTLTWNGSDPVASHYTVYASSLTGQVPAAVTSVGQWPSTGLASDTIFTLIVVTTGPDGTTPVTASLSVAVQVVRPDIKVGNATVAGIFTVEGQSYFAQPLIVDADATFAGTTTLLGNLTATGTVSLQQEASTVQLSTNYTATSDGFLCGSTGNPDDYGWVVFRLLSQDLKGWSQEATFSGGVIVSEAMKVPAMGSGMIAVSAGSTFRAMIFASQGIIPPFSLWWIPVGAYPGFQTASDGEPFGPSA